MKDFLVALEQRLESAPAFEPSIAPAGRMRRRPGLAAMFAAGASAIGLSATFLAATSSADLPILGTATVDASKVAALAPQAVRLGVDFTKGHAFGTPSGPGYVVTDEQRRTVCLLTPAPDEPGSYGVVCAALDQALRHGLYNEFVADPAVTRRPKTDAVFVLPEGAEDVRLVSGRHTTEVTPRAGVFVGQVTKQSHLTWTVNDRPASKLILAPFSGEYGIIAASCPDGRVVKVKIPKGPEAGRGAKSKAMAKLVARAC